MTNIDIERLKQEANKRLFEYISLLESTNDSLLNTLKQCVSLLSQFSDFSPDQEGFKDMLDQLKDIIRVGERVVIKKTLQ